MSDFTQVIVTAVYTWLGQPLSGTVTFELSEPIQNTSTLAVLQPQAVVGKLDATGSISVTLAANTDTTTSPTGSYYRVTENIDRRSPRIMGLVVPATTTTISLWDLATTEDGLLPVAPGSDWEI